MSILTNSTPRQRYLASRLKWYFLTLLSALTITFFLPRLGTVDPVDVILSKVDSAGLSPVEIDNMEQEYRRAFLLDLPLWQQYLKYLGRTVTGDLGISAVHYPMGCWKMIRNKLPWTLLLIVPAVVLAWMLGNILGVLAAYKRGLFDRVLYPVAQLFAAVPFFCFGLVLVFVFYSKLGWVDSLGAYAQSIEPSLSLAFIRDVAAHYWLPFSSVFFILLGGQAVGMRSLSIYEINTNYVRFAKGLGMKERTIIYYIFRNAMLPQLTGLAIVLGTMVGGTFITEVVFSYPGLGTLMFHAIAANDYPLIQAIALVTTAIVLSLNFSVEIAVGFLDPRIKAGQVIHR